MNEILEHIKSLSLQGIPEEYFSELKIAEPNAESCKVTFSELKQTALTCEKCRLHETRKNVVFGVGNENRPPICFIGEGPGADEDRTGEPFVGKAGQLLTAAITKGLGLTRDDVYICNIVKCRPPNNRTPMVDEVEACFPYLVQQVKSIKPEIIVTLGQPAQKAILGIDRGITKVRGSWYEWEGIPVMPTLHPAYLLRNPAAKRDFWSDLKSVMERLDLEAPKRD